MGFYYHYERCLKGEETNSSHKFVRVIISRIRAIGRLTVPLEDKRTTQRVPHAEPTRWRFELNALAFACPRKRKRV